ncbi:hypothetical protein [Burkholderia gladioli]|uniref:hypothetical protein n=1 Tax=Burkholderia gladioli TaxID=28095 RepID=UPI0016407DB1|nr:hypothetical protein [Burkholderia gladioli]
MDDIFTANNRGESVRQPRKNIKHRPTLGLYMKIKLAFSKEAHYVGAMSLFLISYVTFMRYIFHFEWATTGIALKIINEMEAIIPAIEKLNDKSLESINYNKIFFSLFWIISPIFWILGFFGATKLTSHRRKILLRDTSALRIFSIVTLESLLVIFFWEFPMINGMILLNQTSKSIAILFISWWVPAAIIYYHAQMLKVLIMKLNYI